MKSRVHENCISVARQPWLATARHQASHALFLYHTRTIQRTFATSDVTYAYRHDTHRDKPIRAFDHQQLTNARASARTGSAVEHRQHRPRSNYRPGDRDTRSARFSRTEHEKDERTHIPFEGGTGTVDILEDLEEKNMTGRERKAFQDLARLKASSNGQSRASIQITNKEDDRLGAMLEEAFQAGDNYEPDEPSVLRKKRKELRRKGLSVAHDPELLYKKTYGRYHNIRGSIQQAQTDISLWQQLQMRVFARIRVMKLDGSADSILTPEANPLIEKYQISPKIRIWANCLPQILRVALERFRTEYPGSPMGLSLLPALKALGPGHLALGASTTLYNLHLDLLRIVYADVHGFNEILAEMDQGAYHFNSGTQLAIDEMLGYATHAMKGSHGPGLKAVWSTAQQKEAVAELGRWRSIVEKKLREDELKKLTADTL